MTYTFPKDFSAPVLALTTLGEKAARNNIWPNYTKLGIASEHIPELIHIIERVGEFWPDESTNNEPEVYAPIHAWRVLAQFKVEQAIPALFDLVLWNEENNVDWIMEEIPEVMGMIGPACIPPIHTYLISPDKEIWSSVTLAHCLAEIGARHPESRTTCMEALQASLEQYKSNDETVNGFLISFLVDLKAVEAAPLVKRAYQADKVDISVLGDFEDFQIEIGLLEERLTPHPRYHQWVFDSPDSFEDSGATVRATSLSGIEKQPQQEKKENKKQKQAKKSRKRHKKR